MNSDDKGDREFCFQLSSIHTWAGNVQYQTPESATTVALAWKGGWRAGPGRPNVVKESL